MVANTLKKIRVLIVDDSAFMRKVLETILITDENVQVVGHAKDGREAVRLSESPARPLSPWTSTAGHDSFGPPPGSYDH
jgi:CheY-like chemotaxis protein